VTSQLKTSVMTTPCASPAILQKRRVVWSASLSILILTSVPRSRGLVKNRALCSLPRS
jgi:hypothetical protein